MRIACSISAVLVSFALFAEKQPFERYQSIIDRQPFGQPPIGFDPTKPPGEIQKGQAEAAAQQELTLDQQQLQKAVGFSVINLEAGGVTMVGFTDNTDPKIPRHYYLPVGETRNGWKVTSADAVKKTATISKDGVEVSLNLGDNAKSGAPGPGGKGGGGGLLGRRGIGGFSFRNNNGGQAPGNAGVAGAAPAGAGNNGGRGGLLGRGGGLLNRGSQNGIDSFRSRRERREAEERQAAAERAEKEAERKRQSEAAAAKEEEEKKAREQERAEQRQQLMAIQEELRKAREEKARREAETDGNDANDDS